MATQLQLRRGDTEANDALTGASGELTVDTTLNQLRLHDGATAGGHTIGGGGASALDDLSDVTITTPANGAVLTYNGTAWVDGAVALADTDAVSGQLPVANGGTGGASASDARTNLGLAIGTDVQAYDAFLTSIAALGTAADKIIYTTAVNTAAEAAVSAAGLDLIGAADAASQRTKLDFATDYLRENQTWLASPGAGVTLSDVAATDAFLAKSNRNIQQIDLTPYTQVRMTVRVTTGATAGTKLVATYHTAFSTTVGDYVAIGTSAVECALDSTGTITSSWIDLAAGAKADVFTTIKQTGGDGATDPVIAFLTLQFRRR